MKSSTLKVAFYAPFIARIISSIEKEEYVYFHEEKTVAKRNKKQNTRIKEKVLSFEKEEIEYLVDKKEESFTCFLDYSDFPYLEEYFRLLLFTPRNPLINEEEQLLRIEKIFLQNFFLQYRIQTNIARGHRKFH